MTNETTVKTWRERIGAGPEFPLHAPTDVERAMEAEIAELRALREQPELPPLDDELVAILGRPNFMCAGIATRMRQLGHTIRTRAENEQAAVLHLLLGFYLKHGAVEWAERAGEYLDEKEGETAPDAAVEHGGQQ